MKRIREERQPISILKAITIVLISFYSVTIYSQNTNSDNQWWKPITEAHNIEYKNYTVLENYFITGTKTIIGITEAYKDVTIIANNQDEYLVFETENALFNMKLNTLYINNSKMHSLSKDKVDGEPTKHYQHIDYSIDFNTNIATINGMP